MADEKYKLAVASTDGLTVNQHYGRANKFFIYLVDDDDGYDFVEERAVTPVCSDGSHILADMQKSVQAFTDCKYVVAAKIGAGAAGQLSGAGIVAMELPGTIEEAVLKVWKYNQVQRLFK